MRRDEETKDLASMEEKKKKRVKHLLSAGISALAVAVACAVWKGLFVQTDAKQVFRILSDSFLVPGAVLAGVAGLMWTATKGFFDIMGYGCSNVFGRFIPFDSVHRRKESFYDYKMKREERGRSWNVEMLTVGLGCIALSVVLYVIYEVIG